MEMSKEEHNLKLILMQRKKKGMLADIFEKNLLLENFTIPLPKSEQAIPFRNLNCSKPECFYDIQEVLSFFYRSHQSPPEELKCHKCDNRLTLNTFYLDLSLKDIYHQVLENENLSKHESLVIMRNGSWKLKKLKKEKNDDEINRDFLQALENSKLESPDLLETIVNYEKPPQLSDYSSEEFKTLVEMFKGSEAQSFEITLLKNKLTLPRADLAQLMQVEAINARIMRIFLEYLNSIQTPGDEKYKKALNKCLFQGIEVLEFDLVNKKLNYTFLNRYKGKGGGKKYSEMVKEYEKLIFVVNIDGRWIAVIIQFESKEIFITDFLASDLGSFTTNEISKLVGIIVQKELETQYQDISWYQGSKVKFICDCGFYVLNYAYKCMNNDTVENIKTKFSEKELFKKQLIWLFLKLSLTQKNEIHFFDFFVPPRVEDEIVQSTRQPPIKFQELYEADPIHRKQYNKSANNSPLRNKFDKERQEAPKIENIHYRPREPRNSSLQKVVRGYRNSSGEKFSHQSQMILNTPTSLLRNDSLNQKARFLGAPQNFEIPYGKQAHGIAHLKQTSRESINFSPFTPVSKLPPILPSPLYYPGNPLLSPMSPNNFAINPHHRPLKIKSNKSKPRLPLKLSLNHNPPEIDKESDSSRLTTLFEEFRREDIEDAAANKMKAKLGNLLKLKGK